MTVSIASVESVAMDLMLWAAVAGVLLTCLAKVWNLSTLVEQKVDQGLAKLNLRENLDTIGTAAATAADNVVELDRRLRANRASDGKREVLQTLFGTFIGLLGGLFAGWVTTGGIPFPGGQLWRALVVVVLGTLIALVAPVLIFPHLDKILVRIGRSPSK